MKLQHTTLHHNTCILCAQVLEVEMVMADGSLRTFSAERDPFLMRAVRVSVGQLGIITRLRMRWVGLCTPQASRA